MDWKYIVSTIFRRRIPKRAKLSKLKKNDLVLLTERFDMPSSQKNKEKLIEQLSEEREKHILLQHHFVTYSFSLMAWLSLWIWIYTKSSNFRDELCWLLILSLYVVFSSTLFKDQLQYGTYRSRPGDSFRLKIDNFDSLVNSTTNYDSLIDLIVEKYSGEKFESSSIDKSIFFENLVFDQLTITEKNYLEKKLRRVTPAMRNNRNNQEYAMDLLLGWLSEDWFCDMVNLFDHTISTELVGDDSKREFLSRSSSSADVELTLQENSLRKIRIDVFADYLGYASKNQGLDLKPGKIKNLNSGEIDFVIAVDVVSEKYYLFDRTHGRNADDLEYNSRYMLQSSKLQVGVALDFETLMGEIKTILEEE